ncbi:hypothetical protein V7128_02105 [Neobacillus vireti]|uniref:hypothetical protein n=1 Tax=Neobacillus vireti TaxID=220686 RepID=UPI002FFFDD39
MINLEGRYTVAAYNSVGIAYAWDTNIKSVTEENGKVTLIHKPKGSKTAYRHIYDKDQELKIYKGWLKVDLMKDEMVSYENSAFKPLEQYQSKLVYQF